jgi:hypothetical protein
MRWLDAVAKITQATTELVRAMLPIALIVDGQLWGCCHASRRKSPRFFGPAERDALAWLCDDIGTLIQEKQVRRGRQREYDLAKLRGRLIGAIRALEFKELMRPENNADMRRTLHTCRVWPGRSVVRGWRNARRPPRRNCRTKSLPRVSSWLNCRWSIDCLPRPSLPGSVEAASHQLSRAITSMAARAA